MQECVLYFYMHEILAKDNKKYKKSCFNCHSHTSKQKESSERVGQFRNGLLQTLPS